MKSDVSIGMTERVRIVGEGHPVGSEKKDVARWWYKMWIF